MKAAPVTVMQCWKQILLTEGSVQAVCSLLWQQARNTNIHGKKALGCPRRGELLSVSDCDTSLWISKPPFQYQITFLFKDLEVSQPVNEQSLLASRGALQLPFAATSSFPPVNTVHTAHSGWHKNMHLISDYCALPMLNSDMSLSPIVRELGSVRACTVTCHFTPTQKIAYIYISTEDLRLFCESGQS